MSMTCNHHKKLDIEIPSWLWFGIFPAGMKFTEEEKTTGEKIALRVKHSLKEFLRQHDIQNDTITEPNRNDALERCDRCLLIK